MTIVVDTSALVECFTGSQRALPVLRAYLNARERVLIPSPVLYEWLRGPRTSAEIADQEAVFPRESIVEFGQPEAAIAAQLYRAVSRPRGREMDLAIAACAISRGARLWTLNVADFKDVPGLGLI